MVGPVQVYSRWGGKFGILSACDSLQGMTSPSRGGSLKHDDDRNF